MASNRSWAAVPTEEPSFPPAEKGGGSQPSVSSPSPNLSRKWLLVICNLAACLAWLFASTSIIIANRMIMVEKNFHFPMAVASMGMIVSGIAGFIACDVLNLGIPAPPEMTQAEYAKRILPVGIAQGLAGWLSNGLYIYLTVAFIEMARATLPLFTMIALHLAKLESPTTSIVKAVGLTTAGCGIAAYGEVAITVLGLIFLLGNFTLEATRLVMIQFLLVGLDFHPMQSLKMIAPGAVGCLLCLSAIYELPQMMAIGALNLVTSNLGLFLFASSLGLIVNLLSMIIIKLSSATTLKVLAAVRGPIVVVSGVLLFGETVTQIQAVGYAIALAGFVWYQYAKMQQDMAKATSRPK